MKIRVLVPEATISGEKYVAGDTLTIEDTDAAATREVTKLLRSGYVFDMAEETAATKSAAQEATKAARGASRTRTRRARTKATASEDTTATTTTTGSEEA